MGWNRDAEGRGQEERRIAAAAARAAVAGRRQTDEAAEHHDQSQVDVHEQAGLPQREQIDWIKVGSRFSSRP